MGNVEGGSQELYLFSFLKYYRQPAFSLSACRLYFHQLYIGSSFLIAQPAGFGIKGQALVILSAASYSLNSFKTMLLLK